MEFFEVLSDRRKSCGMAFDELSDRSGVPVSTLKKILTGVTRAPQFETLRAITYALGLTLDDLDPNKRQFSPEEVDLINKYRNIDKYGKSLVRNVIDLELDRSRVQRTRRAANIVSPVMLVRRYSDPSAAGSPLYAEQDSELIRCPAEDVPAHTDFAIKVSGHSMEPAIPDGCTAWIHSTNDIRNGDIVIAWACDDGMVCKRIVSDYDQIKMLESINPEHENIEGDALNNVRIYGKVLGYSEKSYDIEEI